MSNTDQTVQVYQLRIWIRAISPQIWRRLLVRSDSTIAQLHDTLQIASDWTDEHLHQFLIRGKPYWDPDIIKKSAIFPTKACSCKANNASSLFVFVVPVLR